MTELLSYAALALVAALLLLSLIRQFAMLGPKGLMLDGLAIVPQWKFFAQKRVDSDERAFDDVYVIARLTNADGTETGWQQVHGWEDRSLLAMFWNPSLRSHTAIAEAAMTLTNGTAEIVPTGLSYLTVLRHCFDNLMPEPGAALQFAVVMARGAESRPVFLRFLSAWHCR